MLIFFRTIGLWFFMLFIPRIIFSNLKLLTNEMYTISRLHSIFFKTP